jgi:hypothetical protein
VLPMTVLVDESPRCVVRPTDMKDLQRFLRNAKPYLQGANPGGKISHRSADETELQKWRDALALHKAWGGGEDDFFGVPL